MEIKQIEGAAKVGPFWKRLMIQQENDGRFRLSISYDEICDLNGKIIRARMDDIILSHEDLTADASFPVLYPLLRDYVRKQLKQVKPEYFPEESQENA